MQNDAIVLNIKLRYQRQTRGWSHKKLADLLDTSKELVGRWERGIQQPSPYYQEKLCTLFEKTAEELGFIQAPLGQDDITGKTYSNAIGQQSDESVEPFRMNGSLDVPLSHKQEIYHFITEHFPLTMNSTARTLSTEVWVNDLLTTYTRGIAACQDLYYAGNPCQVEAILPLYIHQTALLAQQTSTLQRSAARLASQAYQLACELTTDRGDFSTAQQMGQKAFSYALFAEDTSLKVAALISLANLSWHLSFIQPFLLRSHSKKSLSLYEQTISLFDEQVTPLLKGRTYAGFAEVNALQGNFQETMRAMGQAYEIFPLKPVDDPAYPYLRASRYSLYVFGDAQSRLLLHQAKDAEKALITIQKETSDPEMEPITKVDLLYYQVEAHIQQGELESSTMILSEAAMLAKSLGSRLYFDKLATQYHQLEQQWPRESSVVALEEIFQPWQ